MPRESSDAAAIFDMLQAAEAALRHVSGKSREDYECEEVIRAAVERRSKSSARQRVGLPVSSAIGTPTFPGV